MVPVDPKTTAPPPAPGPGERGRRGSAAARGELARGQASAAAAPRRAGGVGSPGEARWPVGKQREEWTPWEDKAAVVKERTGWVKLVGPASDIPMTDRDSGPEYMGFPSLLHSTYNSIVGFQSLHFPEGPVILVTWRSFTSLALFALRFFFSTRKGKVNLLVL